MKIRLLIYTCILFICFGCKSYKTKYPYSLEDFRPELRSMLEKTIRDGIVSSYYSDNFLKYKLSELKMMAFCEHPVIRGNTFPTLCKLDSNFLLKNLDTFITDTAIIIQDRGEWGEAKRYCADVYIQTILGSLSINQDSVLNIILSKDIDYEYSYVAINRSSFLTDKYYSKIKQLAINSNKEYSNNGATFLVNYLGDTKGVASIKALSYFKKPEDVPFIFETMRLGSKHTWEIIQANPDTAYFSLVDQFYNELVQLKRFSPMQFQIRMFGKKGNYIEVYEGFIRAVAAYKDVRSAWILKNIFELDLLPYTPIKEGDYHYYKGEIYDILKENECKEYQPLINKLKEVYEPIYQKHKGYNKR